jgi:hypothetical protein
VVDAAVSAAAPAAGACRVEIAAHCADVEVDLDVDLFVKLLSHLLADMVSVSPVGGKIVVTAARRGALARIEIRGPHTGGGPLHLPIAQAIAAKHGGTVTTHRIAGKGNTHVVEVPVSPAERAGAPGPGRRPREGPVRPALPSRSRAGGGAAAESRSPRRTPRAPTHRGRLRDSAAAASRRAADPVPSVAAQFPWVPLRLITRAPPPATTNEEIAAEAEQSASPDESAAEAVAGGTAARRRRARSRVPMCRHASRRSRAPRWPVRSARSRICGPADRCRPATCGPSRIAALTSDPAPHAVGADPDAETLGQAPEPASGPRSRRPRSTATAVQYAQPWQLAEAQAGPARPETRAAGTATAERQQPQPNQQNLAASRTATAATTTAAAVRSAPGRHQPQPEPAAAAARGPAGRRADAAAVLRLVHARSPAARTTPGRAIGR